MIENSLDKLLWEFKIKAKVLMEVVRLKYPGFAPFETFRTKARQQWLYNNKKPGQAVGIPGSSYHEKGLAVDWIFLNKKWQPTWLGDYPYVHMIGFMCGMTPIYKNKKLVESCHLQSEGKAIISVMLNNSKRYVKSKLTQEQKLLKTVNDCFRKYWYK